MNMGEQASFLIYCLEIYKTAKKLSGKEVIALFEKCGVIDYVTDCYGALHTTGSQYTINGIDEFIEEQKKALEEIA
jgi:hypothetical protein